MAIKKLFNFFLCYLIYIKMNHFLLYKLKCDLFLEFTSALFEFFVNPNCDVNI